MKMNGQSRSFTKQVQIDLLALCDEDLCFIIQQWVSGSNMADVTFEISEETHVALGYTHPHSHTAIPEAEREVTAQWLPPSPQQLRTLLTAMNADLFAQHVISPAFQALHITYPEWDEGVTFNAHLANYLRRLKREL